jgi:hypothetical protein
MMQTFSPCSSYKAGITPPFSFGMEFSSPTAIRSLLTPNAPLSLIGKKIKWVIFLMTLYYYGVPLSVLGRWFSVHKTTILRWIISFKRGSATALSTAVSLWPIFG